jgi:hypothetical protein
MASCQLDTGQVSTPQGFETKLFHFNTLNPGQCVNAEQAGTANCALCGTPPPARLPAHLPACMHVLSASCMEAIHCVSAKLGRVAP